jgi:hypothetical protein
MKGPFITNFVMNGPFITSAQASERRKASEGMKK